MLHRRTLGLRGRMTHAPSAGAGLATCSLELALTPLVSSLKEWSRVKGFTDFNSRRVIAVVSS